MNLNLVGSVRELPGQLVGDAAELLLEHLTARFLIDRLIHRHATAPLSRPLVQLVSIVACLTAGGERRCLKFT
jgi:hypothetical protein